MTLVLRTAQRIKHQDLPLYTYVRDAASSSPAATIVTIYHQELHHNFALARLKLFVHKS